MSRTIVSIRLLSHVSYQISLHHSEHHLTCRKCILQRHKTSIEFKFNEYTHFAFLKYILEILLSYSDTQKIVKLRYRSSSIDNEGKIEFNNFKMKKSVDFRAMWNRIFRYEIKVLIEVDVTISRSIEDIMKILERSPRC